MTTSEIATVLAWHDALNEGDIETLVDLSADDIDVGNAHGAIQGHAALRTWASTSGFTAEPGRMYVREGVVVVEQRLPLSPTVPTSQTVASAFRVVHDKVTSVFRHDDLASALAATDLTEDDFTP